MRKKQSSIDRLLSSLIIVPITMLIVCLSLVFPVLAAQEEPIVGVIDQGDLLSDEEEEKLTDYAEKIAKKHGVHVVALTVTHKADYANSDFGSISFARDFYDEYVKASPIDSPGFLVLIDMENRFLYIHTSNDVIDWVSTDDCDEILDDSYDSATKEQYYEAIRETIGGVGDKITSHFLSVFMSKLAVTLAGAIIPALIVSAVLAYHKRSKVTTSFSTYIDEPKTKVEYDADVFTHQTVTVMHNSSSSSGGGRSRGGGGGGGGRRSGGSGRHF